MPGTWHGYLDKTMGFPSVTRQRSPSLPHLARLGRSALADRTGTRVYRQRTGLTPFGGVIGLDTFLSRGESPLIITVSTFWIFFSSRLALH